MAIVIFTAEMRALTEGVEQAEIAAENYRAMLRELSASYPALNEAVFARCQIAIDGVMIHAPLLEVFTAESELVFVPKIAAG